METGAVVITNLDELSPPEYVHLENVIDIERCEELPTDPAVLDGIRERAVETAAPAAGTRSSRSWYEHE